MRASGVAPAMLVITVALGALALTVPSVPAGAPSAGDVQARQRAHELDALFAKLAAARDQDTADPLVSRIWAQWMQSGRDDVDALMSQAVANMAGQHFGLALLLLDEVITLVPDYAEGWNKRATLLYQMGQHGRSLADIDKVLTLEPRHFGALAGRATIHADAQRWAEALAAYRAALAVNPFLIGRDRVLPLLEKQAGERRL